MLVTVYACLFSSHAHGNDWIYSVRPGDSLWSIAGRCCGRYLLWQELADHNGLATPQGLPPGTQLKIPVALLVKQPTAARVIFAQGTARLSDAFGRDIAVTGGEALQMGDRLRTEDGSVTVELADGSRLVMGNESEIVLDVLSQFGDSGMVDTRIRLVKGRAESDVEPSSNGASHYRISTSSGVAAVRGTDFRVRADGGPTFSEVESGTIDFDADVGVVPVAAGFGLVVEANQPPPPVEALLPAPSWIDVPSSMSLPSTISWTVDPGAIGYRYFLYEGSGTVRLLREGELDTSGTFTLTDLPLARYTFALRPVAVSGLEGLVQTFEFAVLPGRPEVAVAPEQRYGETHVVSWPSVGGAADYRIQASEDPAFTRLVFDQLSPASQLDLGALVPGIYHVRVAARIGNQTGEFSAPTAFEVLLAAPQLASGRKRRTSTTISWAAITGIDTYEVQEASTPEFIDKQTRVVDEPRAVIGTRSGQRWVRVAARFVTPDGAVTLGPVSEIQVRPMRCHVTRASIGSCR